MADRQNYPVGDLNDGQLVQVSRLPEIYIHWYADESITVAGTALALSEKFSQSADVVLITLEDAQVRYRLTGEDPTSTTGHLLNSGDSLLLESKDEIDRFRVIRTSVSATVKASYGVKVDVTP